ncbi:MAG: electron transfer flavoprotein subunit alpha [Deltaproteobacteria bacterium]|nr:electron transfer flavoprotein subunit alpha [Deltaproteobacteria bacterium]
MLKIDNEKCNACGLCEKSCPFSAIAVKGEVAQANDLCTLCGACVNVCPQAALEIERRQVSPEELSQYKGIFIWAECEFRGAQDTPRKVAYEILTQGRRMADQLGEQLCAVVLGNDRLTEMESLCYHGADRVLCCRHELLGRYSSDGFTNVLSAVIAKEKPSIFLYGATPNGRDLAPRVAARMHLGLTADCTGLGIDEQGQLIQTRPAFGGNIMATIVSPYTRPQTATVRPNVFAAAASDLSRPVVIEELPVTLNKANIRTRLIEEIRLESEEERIDEARILVSAGRGCQDQINLDTIRKLARKLGGTLAGSRAIVDLGWIPHSLQVGQSGTTVGPDLYIAIGISGAVQHVVGMSSSKKIIAINKDPDAPIFKFADLGIVGDALVIIPKLIEEIERIKVK